MATSVLHIKTEVECKVFLFDEEKGIATPDKYFNLEVRKGEQDLLFVSTSNEDIQCALQYQIEELDCDYRIILDKQQFENAMIELLSADVADEELSKGIEDDFGVVYSNDGSQLLRCNKELSFYQIKQGCRVIRSNAFGSSKKISKIDLPEGLTHICDHAFYFCENLNSITLPDSLLYIGKCAFYECRKLVAINFPTSLKYIGLAAFSKCENLDNVILPNSITKLEESVFFSCTRLTSISLPTNLKQIGDLAFSWCENLTSIPLPNSITSIGEFAFSNCGSLTEITLPAQLEHIGDWIFYRTRVQICNNSPNFTYYNGCLIDKIENRLIAFLSDAESIELPTEITHIGRGVFKGNKHLINITFPDGVKSIGEEAFLGCENLTNLILPNSIKIIENDAFAGCRKLSCINLPTGLTSIDDGVFSGCEKLSKITLPDGLTTIGEQSFYCCKNLSTIVLPDSLDCICDDAFYGCQSLSVIVLPDNLEWIGECAFEKCEGLSCIYISSIMKEHFVNLLPNNLHKLFRDKPVNPAYLTKREYSYYLFFDTETTGVPQDYNAPASNTGNWPRLVQLGWILTDGTGVIISSGNEIVKPEGFVIPSDASHVHGITTEIALRDGKPLRQVIQSFLKDSNGAKCFVGHNVSFDQRVVGAELYRLGIADTISTAKSLDTMKAATDYCKIPGTYGYKWPKLIELHRKLFGCDFEDAHDAMADITATKKCFFEMKRRGLI